MTADRVATATVESLANNVAVRELTKERTVRTVFVAHITPTATRPRSSTRTGSAARDRERPQRHFQTSWRDVHAI